MFSGTQPQLGYFGHKLNRRAFVYSTHDNGQSFYTRWSIDT